MKALIIIDMEQGFYFKKEKRNNLDCENNILKLREFFDKNNDDVIHVQHRSLDKNSVFYSKKGYQFIKGFEPKKHEKVIIKNVNSAFINTTLKDYLDDKKYDEIVIVGLSLPHCVSTTVRMAGNYGYPVVLIEDATATFELAQNIKLSIEDIHEAHILALKTEFCEIYTTDEYLNKRYRNF